MRKTFLVTLMALVSLPALASSQDWRSVTMSRQVSGEDELDVHVAYGAGRFRVAAAEQGVQISVADTGHGIEPEHLPRIFEPFFTTKKVWTGVGLGLSVAYRVVEDHGGHIEAVSTVGEGTTLDIYLPIHPPAETESSDLRHTVMLE